MRELQKGILVGMEPSSGMYFNTTITIDRNTKRVYRSFTRAKEADDADKFLPGICNLPRTQVLMNCAA
jgi:hypothetical protein